MCGSKNVSSNWNWKVRREREGDYREGLEGAEEAQGGSQWKGSSVIPKV